MHKLIAITRCKNEISIIKKWLKALSFTDLICIVDNGSTDGTYEFLQKQSNVIVTRTFGFHEGRDLNLVLDIAKSHKPEWILKLDCDEIFEDFAIKNFHHLLNQKKINGFLFRKYHFLYILKNNEFRYDGRYLGNIKNPELKLTRYNKNLIYPNEKSHVGDQLFYSFPVALSSFRIKHYSMQSSKKAEEKYKTYIKIKEKNDKGDYSNLINISKEKLSGMKISKFTDPIEKNPIFELNTYGYYQYIITPNGIEYKKPILNKQYFLKKIIFLIYTIIGIIPFGKKILYKRISKRISRS